MNPDRDEQEPVQLSPEQEAMVQAAMDTMKAGAQPVTFEDAIDQARMKVAQWLPRRSA